MQCLRNRFLSKSLHVDRGRRAALVRGAMALSTIFLARGAAAAPKETGLSYEGLLSGRPGFQPRSPMPLPVEEIPGFLSRQQLSRSYDAYRSAFAQLLQSEASLQQMSRDDIARGGEPADRYLAERTRQVNAANAVLLHEFYFRGLARETVSPPRFIRANMNEHMGSMEAWREDFAACAQVAGAWAVLVYDPYDDRWHNLPLEAGASGGMLGNNALVVCDVADHAWSTDYAGRQAYISRFLDHVDWNEVVSRYRAVDRK